MFFSLVGRLVGEKSFQIYKFKNIKLTAETKT